MPGSGILTEAGNCRNTSGCDESGAGAGSGTGVASAGRSELSDFFGGIIAQEQR